VSETANHWQKVARQWSLLGPPLRPQPADTAFARAAIDGFLRTDAPREPRTLVLGVTPELRTAAADAGSRVVCVDRSRDMIRVIANGPDPASGYAACGDWLRLPLPAKSVDLALGDGSFTLLAFPAQCEAVCSELRRVLRSPARVVVRCFVQAPARETLDDVAADLAQGRIGNFRVFRWRVAMALQESAQAGVAVDRIWSAVQERWPSLDRLADDAGWPRDEVRSIEFYRGAPARYNFPALGEYVALFERAGLPVVSVETGGYELGERCPTLVLEKR